MGLGHEVDDQRVRDFLCLRRESSEREKKQEQRNVDPERQRDAGRSALERRALVRGRKAIGGQR